MTLKTSTHSFGENPYRLNDSISSGARLSETLAFLLQVPGKHDGDPISEAGRQ